MTNIIQSSTYCKTFLRYTQNNLVSHFAITNTAGKVHVYHKQKKLPQSVFPKDTTT